MTRPNIIVPIMTAFLMMSVGLLIAELPDAKVESQKFMESQRTVTVTPLSDQKPDAGASLPEKKPDAGASLPEKKPDAGASLPDKKPDAGVVLPDHQSGQDPLLPDRKPAGQSTLKDRKETDTPVPTETPWPTETPESSASPDAALTPTVTPGLLVKKFRDEFADLSRWSVQTVEKVSRKTSYTAEMMDGLPVLKAYSHNAAAMLALNDQIDTYEVPVLRWKWRVDTALTNTNFRDNDTDDAPLRVIVFFAYDPSKAGLLDMLTFEVSKNIMNAGAYPPESALIYAWSGKIEKERTILRRKTDMRTAVLVLRDGADPLQQWREEKVNVMEDYQRLFKSKPSGIATVVIMNDTDGTEQRALSYMDYLDIDAQ